MAMHVGQHRLPERLRRLVESGWWPTGSPGFQEIKQLIPEDLVRKISESDDRIVLMPPPFHTIADEVANGNSFWTEGINNPHEIEYANAVIIADFGSGSDSAIVLYYQGSIPPDVRYLRWTMTGHESQQQWVKSHSSFESFANDMCLGSNYEH